jgi:phosphatidylglycerophosphate synthase
MLDRRVRQWIDPTLARIGATLARRGVTALSVTLVGLGFGLAAAVAIALGAYTTGLVLLLLGRVADGLDGAVARATQPTRFGGFADIMADFAFYGAIPFAFAVADPARGLAAAFLLFSFIGSGVAFLGYAILAAQAGEAPRDPKSFVYVSGLTEGTETIALFVLLCLLPAWFEPLAWGFGILCWITCLGRCWAAWRIYGAS